MSRATPCRGTRCVQRCGREEANNAHPADCRTGRRSKRCLLDVAGFSRQFVLSHKQDVPIDLSSSHLRLHYPSFL